MTKSLPYKMYFWPLKLLLQQPLQLRLRLQRLLQQDQIGKKFALNPKNHLNQTSTSMLANGEHQRLCSTLLIRLLFEQISTAAPQLLHTQAHTSLHASIAEPISSTSWLMEPLPLIFKTM